MRTSRLKTPSSACLLVSTLVMASIVYMMRRNDAYTISEYSGWDNYEAGNKRPKTFDLPAQYQSLISLAQRVQYKGTPLLTFVNEAYLPFTYNWLCHITKFDVLERLIILVDGESAKQKLKERWPNVHVISVDDVSDEIRKNGSDVMKSIKFSSAGNSSASDVNTSSKPSSDSKSVSSDKNGSSSGSGVDSFGINTGTGTGTSGSSHPGNLKYGTAGYVRMMVHRTQILNALVQSSFSFFLLETDFVWLDNPLPDFIKKAEEKNVDFVGTISSDPAGNNLCGAFIYFRNTPRTKSVWQKVTEMTSALGEEIKGLNDSAKSPPRKQEQIIFNSLLKSKYEGVQFDVVDYATVIDGRWYQMPRESKRALKVKAIHNNFIIGNEEKLKRARVFDHWVLNEDLTCNKAKVAKLMRTFSRTGAIGK